ncbi:O-antigen ligase family protein [Mycolicibacterium rhodesiae]|nr:hypothetical protein [Mycolicibacterium rhodesiae]MCV7343915.1 hypothetical protein [Mycolicibacterium rhodesiae]
MTAVALPTARLRTDAGLGFVIGLNLCLAGIYANFAVSVGNYPYPGVAVLIGAAFLIPHMTPHARSLKWLGLIFTFLVLSFATGGREVNDSLGRMTSLLQIIAALGCAHILLCAMNYPKTVRRALFLWTMFIVVGVVLESTFPPFRDLSDAFRHAAFEGRFIYENDARDIQQYGFVRPKLFTREPAHVAMAFMTFAPGWYVLSPFRRRFVLLLICTFLVALFLGSPIVLLVPPLAWFLDRMLAQRAMSGVVAAGLPVLAIVGFTLTQVFSTRFANILSGKDGSFFVRFQGPYEVAIKTIEQFPILGVGVGHKEALYKEVQDVYTHYYQFNTSWVYHNYLYALNNAFANSLSYFGLVGAVVFYFLVAKWAKGFGIGPWVSLPVILLLLQFDGALEAIKMWGSIAVVLSAYAMARTASPRCPQPGGPSENSSAVRFHRPDGKN